MPSRDRHLSKAVTLWYSDALNFRTKEWDLAYVVTQHCVDCRYTDCVTVCPVDAFHAGPRMVYINPDTCVNCDACVPACPVEAIFSEEMLPDNMRQFLALNQEGSANNPVINQKEDPLPGAKSIDELKALDAKGYTPPNFP